MTTYYVRQDGSAANKAAATSELAAATSMSLTQYHAETFSPGDIIYFSGLGGAFTTETTKASIIAVIHGVSSGTLGNVITLAGISGATIDVKDTANSVNGVNINNLNYVLVKDFSCNGSGRLACYRAEGSAGTAGSGYTVEFRDCQALRNYNEVAPTTTASDGFSAAGTAQMILTRPYARKCRENPASTGSNQAQTCHDAGSIKAYNVDYSDCGYAMVNTLNSTGYIYGGTISGMTINVCEGGGDATAIGVHYLYGCTINIDAAGGLGGHTNTTDGSALLMTFDACNINITAGKISSSRGILHIKGGSLVINSTANRITAVKGGTSEGTIRITDGCQITYTRSSSYGIRTDTTGGNLQIEGCVIKYNGANGGTIILFSSTGASTTLNSYIRGNVFKTDAAATATYKAINTLVGNVGIIDISNNTFYDALAVRKMTALDFDLGTPAHTIKNNIFSGPASVITDDGANTIKDYNVYHDCTAPAAPGTNALTTDPQFANAAAGDLTLLFTSPMIANGVNWWGAARRPVGADGEPFSDYETSRGAYQSRQTPSHPMV